MKRSLFSVFIMIMMILFVTPWTLGVENEVIETAQGINLMSETPEIWAQPGVSILEKNDLVQSNLLIDYEEEMTREEFCESIVSIIEKIQSEGLSSGENPFVDTSNPKILKAYYSGITNGKGDGIFAPEEPISRQEYGAMLYRAMKILEVIEKDTKDLKNFADVDQIAPWAKEAVAFLNEEGLMNGIGDNKIAPLELTNRNQGLTLLARTLIRYDETSKNDYEKLLALEGDYVIPENKDLDEATKTKQRNCSHEWFFYDYASNHPHEKVYFCSKCQALSIKPYDQSPDANNHWTWETYSYNENHPHEIVEKCSRCDKLNVRYDLTKEWDWEHFAYNQLHPHELVSKCSICDTLHVHHDQCQAYEIIDGQCSICGINIEAYTNPFKNKILNNEKITDEVILQGVHFIRPLRVSEARINEALIGRTFDNDAKGYLLIKDISQLNDFLENSLLRLPNRETIELLFEEYTLETLVKEMGWPEGNYYYQEEAGSVEKYNFSEIYDHLYFIFVYEEY